MPKLPSFKSYEEAEAFWGANRVEITPHKKYKPAVKIGYTEFTAELARLYLKTKDARFIDAMEALYESDEGKSVKSYSDPPPHVLYRYAEWREFEAMFYINSLMKEGLSLRLSVANCVAALKWPGNSFAAASKSLERLWRAASTRAKKTLDKPRNLIVR